MKKVTVFDIAQYILELSNNNMSICKINKLLYYSQVWNIVWNDEKLFDERIIKTDSIIYIEGFDKYYNVFKIGCIEEGDPSTLTSDNEDTINKVFSYYADKNVQWLNDLIKLEGPYKNTEVGGEITCYSIINYYGCLSDEKISSYNQLYNT